MQERRPFIAAPQSIDAAHPRGSQDATLLGLLLIVLVRSGGALAGDQSTLAVPKLDPITVSFAQLSPLTTDGVPGPGFFAAPAMPGNPIFSSTDFRPRKHTVFDRDPAASAFVDAPMLRGTTVWQRMSAYKSHDRVQVLTLWESSGSTVSLQAGKRGDPSLQWTSRMMNRGGSTQGLLDRLFSASLASAASGFRGSSHTANAPANPRPTAVQSVAATMK
jgi:hypothetical protein